MPASQPPGLSRAAADAHAEGAGGRTGPPPDPVARYLAVGMSKEASRSRAGQRWVTTFARV
jgi:hypothetical protein